MSNKLAIVIHTEGEFDWNEQFKRGKPAVNHLDALVTISDNLLALNAKITFALDYDFISTPFASSFIDNYSNNVNIEFATHLHPWITPPFESESSNNDGIAEWETYPCNLNPQLEKRKLELLTDKIATLAKARPVTYLAGRYGIGPSSLKGLGELGYRVDVSISPYANFSFQEGPDFSQFDNHCIKADDLVFVPHTTGYISIFKWLEDRLNEDLKFKNTLENNWWGKVAMKLLFVKRIRLSPEGYSLKQMKRLTESLVRVGFSNLILSFHSPSLVPDKTPYVGGNKDATLFNNKVVEFVDWALNQGLQPTVAKDFARLKSNVLKKGLMK